MGGPGATPASPRARFHDVRRLDEVDSTNRVALDLARDGAPEGVVVVADHQTAGRGRLDRRWTAPPRSSLLVSVLLRPPIAPQHLHLVTVVVGIAAAQACGEVAGVRPRLKWPNDLLVGDRKLGGILAETVADGQGVRAVVAGMGLNVNWPAVLPDELAGSATALNHEAGDDVDRDALLLRFLDRLDERYGALLEPGGWEAVLLEHRRLCATIGRRVRVELPGGRTVVGAAVDVTAGGHLLVDDGSALHEVPAGDVVHLRPA